MYPDNKKKRLNLNIMSYGVLAMACKTKEDAEILLADMRQEQLKSVKLFLLLQYCYVLGFVKILFNT